jgi:hypothetical protein
MNVDYIAFWVWYCVLGFILVYYVYKAGGN